VSIYRGELAERRNSAGRYGADRLADRVHVFKNKKSTQALLKRVHVFGAAIGRGR
jgi:hypothetical protein